MQHSAIRHDDRNTIHRAVIRRLAIPLAVLLLAGCGDDSTPGTQGGPSPGSTDAVARGAVHFEPVGDMVLAVSEARAVLVGDKVLVTGGDHGVGGVGDMQLYDPALGAFVAFGQMNDPRFVHSLTVTSKDRIVAVSGFNRDGRFLDTVEAIDAATGIATRLHDLCEPRDNQHAVPLPDGRLLLIGGDSDAPGYIAHLEIYDPDGGSDCGLTLDTGRAHEAVADMGQGVAYVFGGLAIAGGDTVVYPRTIEKVDAVARTVTAAGEMLHGRKQFGVTPLQDGRILVTGGFSEGVAIAEAEIYDPATRSSAATGAMHRARAGHSANLLSDGRVFIAGGINADGVESTTEIFDPRTGRFVDGPVMNAARSLHVAQALSDGSVLLAGGYQGNGRYTPAAERLVLASP